MECLLSNPRLLPNGGKSELMKNDICLLMLLSLANSSLFICQPTTQKQDSGQQRKIKKKRSFPRWRETCPEWPKRKHQFKRENETRSTGNNASWWKGIWQPSSFLPEYGTVTISRTSKGNENRFENWLGREIGGKITVFDWGEGNYFWFEYEEVRKNKGVWEIRIPLYLSFTKHFSADRLAQLVEHRTAVREVAGSNLDRTNREGL